MKENMKEKSESFKDSNKEVLIKIKRKAISIGIIITIIALLDLYYKYENEMPPQNPSKKLVKKSTDF